ncbi:site-specific DNA-methyltransferase [Runella sp.]|uniref:DNA-methyltransferase n=1 Tax=Runella sp. TaxID=1960881 RepID=UPI003017A7AF
MGFEGLKTMRNKVFHGDCLEIMPNIPDKSVDMILCDLPYGSTQCHWDSIIPFEPLWRQYERIIKNNGAIVLTASQPFTSALVMSNPRWFKYDWIWEKSRVTNVLNAKKQPLRCKEDVLIFYPLQPIYNPQGVSIVNKMVGTGATNANKNGNCTGKITQTNNGKYFQEIGNYPRQILKFPSDSNTIHPTQKPVALFEYLIKTYTNEGDVILDNCAGSFTTAIAAMNTNRDYICIEQDDTYFELGCKRIAEHEQRVVQLEFEI